jgi:hypothetical protein
MHLLKVAKMFEKHFTGILSYIKHHVTNAIAEGLNSQIQQTQSKSNRTADAEDLNRQPLLELPFYFTLVSCIYIRIRKK